MQNKSPITITVSRTVVQTVEIQIDNYESLEDAKNKALDKAGDIDFNREGTYSDAEYKVENSNPPSLEEHYLNNGGHECPKCERSNLETGKMEIDAGGAFQEIVCEDCGATWDDCYTLTGILTKDDSDFNKNDILEV